MKKLIDIDDTTFESLSIMAIKARTNLKGYIESVLVTHASRVKGNLNKIRSTKNYEAIISKK